MRRASENAGPLNVTPDGNGFAIGAAAGTNPPGTVMLGYPAFAGVRREAVRRREDRIEVVRRALDAVRAVVNGVQVAA